jgi:RimJ/RimL family protein N-acetyltransferase
MPTSHTLPAPPFQLAGSGLVLRDWTDEDVPAMAALFDDPDVARWTPLVSPFDADAARRYLDRCHEGRAAGRRLQLAVTLDGDEPLGEVLLMLREEGEVELGYAIGVLYRGQGLTARAIGLLNDFAYTDLEVRRIILRIEPGNTPSEAVARRAGFHRTDEPPAVIRDPDGTVVTLGIWEHRPTAPVAR